VADPSGGNSAELQLQEVSFPAMLLSEIDVRSYADEWQCHSLRRALQRTELGMDHYETRSWLGGGIMFGAAAFIIWCGYGCVSP